MRYLLLLVMLVSGTYAFSQSVDSTGSSYQNSADRLLTGNNKLMLGGYGEVHFNQPLSSEQKNNGMLDVHRVVLLFGYNFNDRTKFVSEIEFEHVSEVYVEQAFLQYKINKFMNFRAGLLLIPMGIVNEYHEPTTFHGVERPLIDKYIAPTTWREIGAGISGTVMPAKIKYQVYLVNGFNGWNGEAKLGGENGLRKGRQKGAESFISSPNLSAKIDFFGVRGLNIGMAGYFGKTQSTAFQGLDKNNQADINRADSSVVGIAMAGLDARYTFKGIELRGQYYITSLSNTKEYNVFTATDGTPNDLGKSLTGYYVEAGYNVLRSSEKCTTELVPFIRYEGYNMHNSVEEGIEVNKAYDHTVITTGITWRIATGAVFKTDIQFVKSEADNNTSNVFNAGIGVMF